MVLPCILSHEQTVFISCTLFQASACIFVCAVSVLLSLTIIIHTKLSLSFVRHVYIVRNACFIFIYVCLSVCLHVSTRLLLAGFLWSWILETLWNSAEKLQIWGKNQTNVSGTSHKDLSTFMLLTVKILCISTTVQREIIVAFLWQHTTFL